MKLMQLLYVDEAFVIQKHNMRQYTSNFLVSKIKIRHGHFSLLAYSNTRIYNISFFCVINLFFLVIFSTFFEVL